MEGGRLELWPIEVDDADEAEDAKITITPEENKIAHFRWGRIHVREGVYN